MTTFLSSAFLQQCFAMHRLDLAVRQLKGSGIVVVCRQCKIRHTVRVQPWSDGSAPVDATLPVFSDGLVRCAADHAKALNVHAVEVMRESLDLACGQCRTTEAFRIAECVTRQVGAPSG